MPRDRRRTKGSLPEVTLDEQKLQLCLKVFGDDSVLSHVFRASLPSGRPGWKVEDQHGDTIITFTDDEVAASRKDRFDFVVDIVQTLYCADCTTRLLEGEERVCGPCEAKQVMELLRMRAELAADDG
jgi:hypothetical protein